MSTIVAGRFERSLDADAALEALRRDGFSPAEIDSFASMPGRAFGQWRDGAWRDFDPRSPLAAV
jgi:hypothetical protein